MIALDILVQCINFLKFIFVVPIPANPLCELLSDLRCKNMELCRKRPRKAAHLMHKGVVKILITGKTSSDR